jgi:hypothetical protein
MKMNKLFAALLIASSVPLSGCSAPELNCEVSASASTGPVKSSVSVILAPTSSFVNFDDAFKDAFAEIKKLATKGGTEISAVSGDGAPRLLAKRLVEIPEGLSDAEIQKEAGNATVSISRAAKCLTTLEPQGFEVKPESDLFSALGEAVRAFPEDASGPENQIFLVGNGFVTSGEWSFTQKGGIPAPEDLSEVITNVISSGIVQDLRGATVHIYGLGQTNSDDENPPLTNATRVALRNFWTSIVENANGKVGTFEDGLVSSTPVGRTIKVAAVASLPTPCLETSIMDAQSGFSFTGDRAEFVDLPAAKEIARKIVSDITSASCVKQVTITGFVASGTSKALYSEREGDALANNRAKAFAKLLIDAGLPKAVTIKTVGGGKGPYNDWGPDGAFDEEKGKKNRFAVVTFD